MRFSVNPIVVLAALASQTFATVFVTNPIGSSSIKAGQTFNVVWQNNAAAPVNFGIANIDLYVGSTIIQEQVVQLAASVNTTNTTTLNVTINADAGPNFDGYFLRFTSISATDPNNSAVPAEAFSALFTLTGMTGQFTEAQQSAVAAASSNSSSPSATPVASTPPNSSSNTTAKSSSGSSTTPSSPAQTSAKPSQPASGAISVSINSALFGALLLGGAGLLL